MKRTKKLATFEIDPQAWEEFKRKCSNQGTNASAVLVEFVNHFLGVKADEPSVTIDYPFEKQFAVRMDFIDARMSKLEDLVNQGIPGQLDGFVDAVNSKINAFEDRLTAFAEVIKDELDKAVVNTPLEEPLENSLDDVSNYSVEYALENLETDIDNYLDGSSDCDHKWYVAYGADGFLESPVKRCFRCTARQPVDENDQHLLDEAKDELKELIEEGRGEGVTPNHLERLQKRLTKVEELIKFFSDPPQHPQHQFKRVPPKKKTETTDSLGNTWKEDEVCWLKDGKKVMILKVWTHKAKVQEYAWRGRPFTVDISDLRKDQPEKIFTFEDTLSALREVAAAKSAIDLNKKDPYYSKKQVFSRLARCYPGPNGEKLSRKIFDDVLKEHGIAI